MKDHHAPFLLRLQLQSCLRLLNNVVTARALVRASAGDEARDTGDANELKVHVRVSVFSKELHFPLGNSRQPKRFPSFRNLFQP